MRLRTSAPKGYELLDTIDKAVKEFQSDLKARGNEQIGWAFAFAIHSQSEAFQTLIAAELSLGDIYVVSPKGAFDTTVLAEHGFRFFPDALATKVPESINDAKEAARCIAFELPTAAAFHMHRITELVLRRYYDTVTGGKPRPEKRNIGAYIDALKNHQVDDRKIFSALAALKDFHRNPVLHPDDRLESVEEALALHGQICTAITYMLQKIPEQLVLQPSPAQLPSPESVENVGAESQPQEVAGKAA